jgi:uncharacterized protein (TIGR03437 family)
MKVRCRAAHTLAMVCGLAIIAHTGICQSLVVTPRVISFNATADSTILPTEFTSVGIVASDGGNLPFKLVGLSPGTPNFLVVSPPSGVTPASVLVGLNPNVVPYLPSGNYGGLLWFSKPGESCPPCAGPSVTLRLTSQPPPKVSAVASAATLQTGPIAPWQVVSIFGEHLGTPPVSSHFDAGGLYPTTLGNSTVTFSGAEGALLYVSTNQINVAVPFGVAGQKSVEIVVAHNLAKSPPFSVPVADTAPGIFTVTQNGSGQGAILNYGFSLNSVDNPAPKGAIITMFGTGAGLWNQSFPDGSIYFGGPLRTKLAAPVSLTIGGQPATIQYAGGAPYQVMGVFQVNATVPDGIGSGPQPVVLTIGQNNNAQQQATVAVQ